MPAFAYQGVDRAGKKVSGTMEAGSEGDLRMVLRTQGVRPIKIARTGGAAPGSFKAAFGGGGGNLNLQQLVTFTRQLQVLINSGIPIVQGLELLGEQGKDPKVKAIIVGLREKVSSGSYFWEALSLYPKAFPKLYIALVRAGESSGSIDKMLKRLSRYLEDADRLRRMVKGAMMYPAIVVCIGIAVVFGMLIFVIPKFEELLKSNGQELPAFTQAVITCSHFLIDNIIFVVGGAAAAIYVILAYVKSPEGKAFVDRAMFRAPLFGTLMQKAGTARFSRTMQTLLSSGVNLLDAIDICRATVDNAVLEQAVSKIRADVEGGKTLGQVISKLTVFPNMAVQMIAVGETTGNLDQMLEKVADFYEEEVETLVQGLTKLIEPLILVLLGGTVGGLLIAMYLPIFKLAGSAQ